ncbi:MAG: hypothetical protein K9G67_06560 [Bacteroidales bacterium]|nr:hypothetical protein [Bacteroidales bacterium]MCF8343028.1 hypothetical protein [Bacteroidales bacterium]MCF8350268.1 hypothetical protein [Bacteroidales bacterium]MCF8376000.1 hypothetical protein [Bacteroidales bacterium]MCF8400488.1 hypothetical protein [Bacteroidales bacterium]
MKISESYRKLLFVLSLLINLILILQIFGNLSGWNLDYFFNSDGLYLASIYKDLFIDNNGLEGWHLNAAPNFFPEWPLYFLLHLIADNFRIASLLYALMYILLLNTLTAWIFKTIANKVNFSFLAMLNLVYAIILNLYFYNFNFILPSFLLLTGYHAGVFLMTLLSYALFFRYLKYGKTWILVALFVTIFTGVISDRLLLTYFIVPSLSALLLIHNKVLRKKIVILTTSSLVATILGFVVYGLIKSSDFVYFVDLGYRKIDITKFWPTLVYFSTTIYKMLIRGSVESIMTGMYLIGTILGLWFSFIYLFQNKRKFMPSPFERILLISFTASTVLVALTPVINGTFWGIAHFRYNFYTFCFGLSLFVFIIYLIFKRDSKHTKAIDIAATSIVILAFISIFWHESKQNTPKGLSDFAKIYPTEIANIDSLAGQYNLTHGVADYWVAKRVTIFSQNNLRVYTVNTHLSPWLHVTNENWYTGSKNEKAKPIFEFIVLNKFNPTGEFYQKLVKSSDTIQIDNTTLLKVRGFSFNEDFEPYIVSKDQK